MSSKPIERSPQSIQKAKAKRKNLLAIIFVLIGLFATLTLTVINQPGWAFGLAGGLLILIVALYAKEIIQSIRNRK